MKFRGFALLLVVVALVACNNEKNRNLLDRRTDQAIVMAKQAQEPAPKQSYNPLVVSQDVWSGNSSIRLRRGVPLPSKYENARGVTLISSEDMSLNDISMAISSQTGIPVRLTDGADSAGSVGGADGGGMEMPVAYEGPLSGLLDVIAGNYGLNWRFDGSAVRMSRYETRVFTIEAMPGTQSVKDGAKQISSNNSSTTSGGGNTESALDQTSSMTMEIKFWDELKATLQSMVGSTGTVILAPSSGTATISTTPELMRGVAKFIEEENRRLTQQIAINVEIYSVALGDGADFSVSFDAAFKKFGALKIGPFSGAGFSTETEGLGNLSLAILDSKHTGDFTSVFSALSTIGDTTRVTQFPLTTLNNRAVTRRVGRDVTYVKSISQTESGSDFSSTSIEPGNILEGFALQATPRVLDDGRILLQYSFSLTDIVSNEPFRTGDGSIQLPETATRVFVQQAMLKSGATLVIGGYDDEQVLQSSQGMGNPYNYFLGGGSSNAKTRSMMVIALTPQVLNVQKAERE